MEIVSLLFYFFLFLCTVISYLWVGSQKWKLSLGGAKLPPGSMGWPYIGETHQFYSQNPNDFFARKQKRYGEIFKTHLLGCPCVMLASPEAAKFVLVNQAHLFKPTYPKSKEQMIGPSALFFHQGDYHMRLRKLVQGSLMPEAIKNLVLDIDTLAVALLDSWNGSREVNTFHEMKKYSFDVGILAIFGQLSLRYKEELKKNYCIVDKGYNSFPTNIPGTLYNNAVLARKRLSKILSEIVRERREAGLTEKDLLGCLMNSKDEKGKLLRDDQIADNIIGVLFAAQDTTASVMTWIVKYLHDDPKLLQAVRVEQRAIHEANDGGKRPLTWAQTRNMPLTHKFDPSRFEVPPKPNTLMPFGNGVHACPGNELAKLESLILIHHLVTKFRWEVEGSESGIQYGPFPVPMGGLPAKFWKQKPEST
ncbi:abscisic acid 8'-hydroxylase CYP707A1-like isoform X2 [Aristolochia californica]|uniref:abscisic acid 8'-hydroxylase CYP707A1-like isoform X2 n=1 Tax=Aristolochia californica TaxID=171875 RepID=UPI0035DB9DA8